ncbi:MAG: UbiD family decarboxylase, partial [Thermoguttaceae bacterium]
NPNRPGIFHSNLGMYRVQLAGNQYKQDEEIGLHYQLQRGIAPHHAAAIAKKTSLPVNIYIGGAPAMTIAAIMPLPEDVPELTFAGMLGRHRIPLTKITQPLPIYAEADFCICGYLEHNRLAPEGPFGDHLGYYSNSHEFPVLRVEKVFHRKDAIFPFTVVGRPPQEDSVIGAFIHQLADVAVSKKIPGVHAIHAVDEAGVHPLLLAIGSERYVPYQENVEKPENTNSSKNCVVKAAELHTLAHAILGFGQLSLAKYLFLVAKEDAPNLSVYETDKFLLHVLERVNWACDLHFTTQTNTDTLDYTGIGLNRGSKVAVCVAGKPIRNLPDKLSDDFSESINRAAACGFTDPKVVLPGILTLVGPDFDDKITGESSRRKLAEMFTPDDLLNSFPLIVLVDKRAKQNSLDTFADFLWTTFTKSDPANDLDGIGAFTVNKHWGTTGSLIIDARSKPHHAEELE